MKQLEQVLADWRETANALRRTKHHDDAKLIDDILDEVRVSLTEYLTWLSEPDARLRSGRTVEWLRGRFAEWAGEGLAELRSGRRYYRAVIVPQRAHASAAYEAGYRGEKAS